MRIGDVVADRFSIERRIGSGGMGSVFLAADRTDGRTVAVKILDLATEATVRRFRREARVLAELAHPGIVRYVTHGETEAREAFLVMELLEGENLAQRLARSGLSAEQALGLVTRVADALAFAHSKGIVHRDVKPSNLFLVGRDVERVKVLDFGIAHTKLWTKGLTRSGAMLGTVGYMAPEQASGERDVDVRADVFSLGCVLFECLTGKPAFSGRNPIAVLAKVQSVAAPRVSESRPELGAALDDLVARMLAKRSEDRPRDLSEVAGALEELRRSVRESAPSRVSELPASLSDAEQRIVSVILAEPAMKTAIPGTGTAESQDEALGPVRRLAERSGAKLMFLQSGALLMIVSGRDTASDQAIEGATCALALRRIQPDLRIALATGRAEKTGQTPVGPAIDRAASLLERTADEGTFDGGVLVDDSTEGLLGARFDVERAGTERILVRERADLQAPRLLMGKPTPTVGRDKELALLEGTLLECASESASRVVLVTAPPGVGKSRLAMEFLRRAQLRGGARTLVGRADPTGAGSSLSLAQQLVVQAIGLHPGASAAHQLAQLGKYVSERRLSERGEFVAEFLGEIIGISSDQAPSPFLRAARNDPAAMQEQKRRAFEALVDGEVGAGPVLVVLEDLHWGDEPTLRYLDEALRRHANRPLMVLALARPEVHERFPKLWESAGLQEIRLGALTRKAAERLVTAALGNDVDTQIVARVVDRAEGNAFYLEELIRRVADGDATFPETVLAMAQSRIERLEPEARRILRAASVYGETCWSGAVSALAGKTVDSEGWLEALADRELLVRSRDSRFPAEREYLFRHALLRDAAYGMLTDEDRQNAHALAGAWLESAGERDAWAIADHFDRGGEIARAVPWICRAAELAVSSGDLSQAIARAQRGRELGAAGEVRGLLLAIEGLANVLSNRPVVALMEEALAALPAGSALWWGSLGILLYEAGSSGQHQRAGELVQLAFSRGPGDALTAPYGMAINGVCGGLCFLGQTEMARGFLERFEGASAQDPKCDPLFVAWLDVIRSFVERLSLSRGSWQLERSLTLARQGVAGMAASGAIAGEAQARFQESVPALWLGLLASAEEAMVGAISLAQRVGAEMTTIFSQLHLAHALTRTGRLQEAVDLLASLDGPLNPFQTQIRESFLADAHLRMGRADEAERRARAATQGPPNFQTAIAASIQARALVALDHPQEAIQVADGCGHALPSWAADLLTSKALALRALGREEEARAAAAGARDVILAVARDIQDPDTRRAFLTNVDENIRTLAVAGEWLGD